MSEGTRPGGLTALAVLNFIFGGFGVLSSIGMALMLVWLNTTNEPGAQGARDEIAKVLNEIGKGPAVALVASSLIADVLQIVAGIGYLQQKKVLGRRVGNVFALVAVASSIVMAVLLRNTASGFTLQTLAGLIYPVLTIFLLNVTFKEDFIH